MLTKINTTTRVINFISNTNHFKFIQQNVYIYVCFVDCILCLNSAVWYSVFTGSKNSNTADKVAMELLCVTK